jgi:hypothetical protein
VHWIKFDLAVTTVCLFVAMSAYKLYSFYIVHSFMKDTTKNIVDQFKRSILPDKIISEFFQGIPAGHIHPGSNEAFEKEPYNTEVEIPFDRLNVGKFATE